MAEGRGQSLLHLRAKDGATCGLSVGVRARTGRWAQSSAKRLAHARINHERAVEWICYRLRRWQEPDSEILDEALRLVPEADLLAEAELVQRIVDSAEARRSRSHRTAEHLEAVVGGKVDTLAVAEGVATGGAACPRCDYFAAEPFRKCPRVLRESEPIEDIVDYAVERAIRNRGRVKLVGGKAREWLLARGGVGAVLRYVATTGS